MDPVAWLRQQLEHADVDLLREMVRAFADALMSAEVDGICGADYGESSVERVNRRNGYRRREWDTRAGTIELAIPKLRKDSYFPGWLLEPRRRAEQALVQVIADCYLAGVSTRRVDKLVGQLGLDGMSKSQVSELAKPGTTEEPRWMRCGSKGNASWPGMMRVFRTAEHPSRRHLADAIIAHACSG